MEYGLIGNPLGHSYSAKIHPLLGGYDYRLFELPESELAEFLRRPGIGGLNVTIPYKRAVIPYCNALTDTARKIGSVNTLLYQDGRIIGHNTDYEGFLALASRIGIDFSGKKVVILGSGGTSLTARHAAADSGAQEIVIISRSGEDNYENLARHADAEILINTTPVGMFPHCGESPVSLDSFPCLRGVIDVIYNPLRTKLVLDALARGIPAGGGLPMLIYQARAAAELFLQAEIPAAKAEAVLRQMEADVGNVVLIGMPGSGKSFIGDALARLTGRKFVDIDTRITELAGKNIPAIFAENGEAAFRALERQAVAEVGSSGGQVISTGGGAVLDEQNYAPLKQNGTIFFLNRALEKLPTEGRPLSTDLAAMQERRLPCYLRFADFTIDNDGPIASTIAQILRKLEEAE